MQLAFALWCVLDLEDWEIFHSYQTWSYIYTILHLLLDHLLKHHRVSTLVRHLSQQRHVLGRYQSIPYLLLVYLKQLSIILFEYLLVAPLEFLV